MEDHGEVQVQQYLTMRTSLVLLFSAKYQFVLLLVLISCNFSIDD
jgi:hypothetical protein